jgi:negative regulator of sigma-B (phosphoserine phosphatase)
VPDRASPTWPSQLELGIAERALPGQYRSGDRAVLAAYEGGALVAAIDGLGHGSGAAEAAAVAAEVLAAHPDDEPARLLEACHDALSRTRGAVMTLAWFDLDEARLSWTGVGNVEGRLVHAGTPNPALPGTPTEGALTKGGVVGYNLPSIRVTGTELLAGDVMVLATDGIDSGFAQAIVAGASAQDIADRILADHGKQGDDALVVVVRYHAARLVTGG